MIINDKTIKKGLNFLPKRDEGFYICNIKDIFNFLETYNDIVYELYVPEGTYMYKVSDNKQFIVHSIIVTKILHLRNLKTYEYLLSQGAKITDKLFNYIVVNGNVKVLEFLFVNNIVVDQRDYDILNIACLENQFQVVKYLVKNGFEVNHECFVNACVSGDVRMINYLFDFVGNEDKSVGLRVACESGNLNVVKFLVENGADINSYYNNPLISACRGDTEEGGYLPVVKYLISRGANLHVDDDAPLIIASATGNLSIVEYLVDHGADINARNGAALDAAIDSEQIHILQYLLYKGAFLGQNSSNQITAAPAA